MWFRSRKNRSDAIKVKIVAVAKDEGAYFPEWVFHHLYLGFDSIDIYVNRTSDNSEEMISKISRVYPQVNFINADWVDQSKTASKNMQIAVYKKAMKRLATDKEFDYVFYIDIDEYWTPQNLTTKVQDIIQACDSPDCISFGWLNENGREEEFSDLERSTFGCLHGLVKSLVKVSPDTSVLKIHKPELKSGVSCLVDGQDFVSSIENQGGLQPELVKLRQVMIIHRMYRSPMEYVSSLNRGNPAIPNSLKLNRHGYNTKTKLESKFCIEEQSFLRYKQEKFEFLNSPSILAELEKSKLYIRARFFNSLASVYNIEGEDYPALIRVFTGCTKGIYQPIILMVQSSSYIKESTDVNYLVKLATNVETLDKSLAQPFWQTLSRLNSTRPVVVKKLAEYAFL